MNSHESIKQEMDIYGNSYNFHIDVKIKDDPVQLEIKQEIGRDSNMPISDNSYKVSCILSEITKAQVDNESFQCSQCEKCFAEQGSLEQHLRMHSGEESHQCTNCGSCFPLKGDLVRHQRTHTGENPFQCSECDKVFALKDDLMNHLRAHTGEKLVQCSHCKSSFSQQGNLEQHQTIHTGEKPHQCINCDKYLAQKDHLLGFQRTTEKKYKRYSLEEKEKIADLVEKYKDEYEKEVSENKKLPKQWNAKLKKFSELYVKGGFVARAIRELYPSLANVSNEDLEFRRARSVAKRCLESRQNKRKNGELISTGSKHKFRKPGGGMKAKAIEVRQAAFEWFVDIRDTLKGSLPTKIFKAKCVELYEFWLADHAKEIKAEDQLKFSNHWIREWMREYNVSLFNPNKRLAISQEDRILRITEFLKNVMRVRYYFQVHFKKEPVIISGDQMPLHRNESPNEKTVMQEKQDMYVKENHTLSRERATVYTQLSTEPQNAMPTPEILFKGKYVRIHTNPHLNMTVQCAPKGSYRIENMLKTVKTLKNRHQIHSQKDYALYILDDYSVHIQDKLRQILLQQGYVLVIIGGGITGDIQINDTHLHHQLKIKYCEKESELMLQKLRADPNNVPTPTRDEMMQMILESWGTLEIDPVKALKNNFVLNAFDGSEDYLVTDNLMKLVGEEIKAFRKELLSSSPPQSIQELIQTITPPKGAKIKRKTTKDVPPDEGRELIDCEGDEIPVGEEGIIFNEDEAEESILISNQASLSLITPPTATKTYDLTTNTPDCINRADSEFLKDIADVLNKHRGQTSKLLLPYYCQFQDTLTKSRCSLKKHILSNTQQSKELTRYVHGDDPINYMTEQQPAFEDPLLNSFSQNEQLT